MLHTCPIAMLYKLSQVMFEFAIMIRVKRLSFFLNPWLALSLFVCCAQVCKL